MSKFAIDAGHGVGYDTGAVGFLNEQNCALDITNKIIAKLQSLGHTAFGVRPSSVSSVTDSLQKRCDSARNADYLVSIHLNAGGGVGSEVFAMSENGYKLAQSVQNQLVSLGFRNRGVKDGSGLYVIKHSNPVAILVEVCFVDTQSDVNLYNSLGSEKIANAIVKGLTGQTINTTSTTTSTTTVSDFSIAKLQSYIGAGVDGIAGSETLSKCPLIKNGSNNNCVKWLQAKLNSLGYNCGTPDGIFGNNTYNVVISYQSKNKLGADGIVGRNTWSKLLGLS